MSEAAAVNRAVTPSIERTAANHNPAAEPGAPNNRSAAGRGDRLRRSRQRWQGKFRDLELTQPRHAGLDGRGLSGLAADPGSRSDQSLERPARESIHEEAHRAASPHKRLETVDVG